MAEGLQNGLWSGGGGGEIRRGSAYLSHDGEEIHGRRKRPGEGTRDRRNQVGEKRKGPIRAERNSGHGENAARATRSLGHGIPRARAGAAQGDRRRDRSPLERESRAREIHDQYQGRV